MSGTQRAIGADAEALAAAFLEKKGYRITDRNFTCPGGELDLVAERDGALVFVEVKFRRTSAGIRPAEAVTGVKRLRLSRAVGAYLARLGGFEGPMRFDVIEITGDGAITHLENAFVPGGF